jgi:Terminase RNaseH-like domain
MSRALVTATWDDTPHLSADAKSDLITSYLPHELEARTLGIPSLGRGAVYPLAQSDYTCDPFMIPQHFKRAFGLDVGWNWTAAVWIAWDLENDIDYVFRDYLREQAPPDVHASAIKAAGEWIPGCIDPAAKQRSQLDGRNLLAEYSALGLKLSLADNSVEAGVTHVYLRLAAGKTKIFRTCTQLLEDLRFYHRDEQGKVVKERDHLPDAFRYVEMSGHAVAKVKPLNAPVGYANGVGARWAWG